MNSNIKLLPCPFCGGNAFREVSVGSPVTARYLECLTCFSRGPLFKVVKTDQDNNVYLAYNKRYKGR